MGSSRENGHYESFNCKLRAELLNREIFYSLAETRVLIEPWRFHYDTARPHSALGCRPPAPEAIIPRNGSITPRASALVAGATRSPTATVEGGQVH